MWIFSRLGFYSVNQSTYEPGKLQIRAREREHLQRLIKQLFEVDSALDVEPQIIETPKADYPYRIMVSPADWAIFSARLA